RSLDLSSRQFQYYSRLMIRALRAVGDRSSVRILSLTTYCLLCGLGGGCSSQGSETAIGSGGAKANPNASGGKGDDDVAPGAGSGGKGKDDSKGEASGGKGGDTQTSTGGDGDEAVGMGGLAGGGSAAEEPRGQQPLLSS